jgi:hypothetical protein
MQSENHGLPCHCCATKYFIDNPDPDPFAKGDIYIMGRSEQIANASEVLAKGDIEIDHIVET